MLKQSIDRRRIFDVSCRSQNADDKSDLDLLRNTTVNTVIVDFTGTSDLKTERNVACKSLLDRYFSIKKNRSFLDNIIIRASSNPLKNDPIDTSFLSFSHPSRSRRIVFFLEI